MRFVFQARNCLIMRLEMHLCKAVRDERENIASLRKEGMAAFRKKGMGEMSEMQHEDCDCGQ